MILRILTGPLLKLMGSPLKWFKRYSLNFFRGITPHEI